MPCLVFERPTANWRTACVLLLCLWTASASAAASNADLAAATRAGSVQVGDSFAALSRRGAWTRQDEQSLDDCAYHTGPLLPPGVAVMVVAGTVTRFDLDTARSPGPFGLRIGDSTAAARRKMPAGTVLESGYRFSETRHLVWQRNRLAVRVALTPEGQIDHIAWGRREAVNQADACL